MQAPRPKGRRGFEQSPCPVERLAQPLADLRVDVLGTMELDVVHPDPGEGLTTDLNRGEATFRPSAIDRTAGTLVLRYCPGHQT